MSDGLHAGQWRGTASRVCPPLLCGAAVGAFDSVAGVMQSLAISKLSKEGGLVVLLLQSAIPLSICITKVFLGVKYKAFQYIGAGVVLAGIVVALIPQLTGNSDAAATIATWASVLVLSCVPMTLSSVYKEKALGDTEIDPIFLNVRAAALLRYCAGRSTPSSPSPSPGVGVRLPGHLLRPAPRPHGEGRAQ